MPVDLQEIDGLEYSLSDPSDEDCEWHPITGTLTLLQGYAISFRAKPKHPDIGWKNGDPLWEGDCWFSGSRVEDLICGETITGWFLRSSPVLQTVRAIYGDSSADAIVQITPQGSLLLRSTKQELMAGADPATEYGFADFTAQVRRPDLSGVPSITVAVVSEDAVGQPAGQIICPSEVGCSFLTDADGIARFRFIGGNRQRTAYVTATATLASGQVVLDKQPILVENPTASVELSEWQEQVSGEATAHCHVWYSYLNAKGEDISLAGRRIRLSGQLYARTEARGYDCLADTEQYITFAPFEGVTDSEGNFSSVATYHPYPDATVSVYVVINVWDDKIINLDFEGNPAPIGTSWT